MKVVCDLSGSEVVKAVKNIKSGEELVLEFRNSVDFEVSKGYYKGLDLKEGFMWNENMLRVLPGYLVKFSPSFKSGFFIINPFIDDIDLIVKFKDSMFSSVDHAIKEREAR